MHLQGQRKAHVKSSFLKRTQCLPEAKYYARYSHLLLSKMLSSIPTIKAGLNMINSDIFLSYIWEVYLFITGFVVVFEFLKNPIQIVVKSLVDAACQKSAVLKSL